MKIRLSHAFTFASLLQVSIAGSAIAAGDLRSQPAGAQPGIAQADAGRVMVELAVDRWVDVMARSFTVGRADPAKVLHVTVSLPYADAAAAERFAESVSDPASPNFRQFITPEEVGERFGLPQARVDAVAAYLRSQGLTVTFVSANRLAISCSGTVAQFEQAFGTRIDEYAVDPARAPAVEGGNARFHSPSTPLMAPASIARDILDVSGEIDGYVRPQPRQVLNVVQTRGCYTATPIYSTGGYTGLGRTTAISNFDGFRLTNVNSYYSTYALPVPAGGVGTNVTTIVVGTAAGTGTAGGEGDLDIQMALGMAPLSSLRIYDSTTDLVGVLSREASDNLADVISESYGWNISTTTATSAHNQHVSMTSQGITYMCASGDSGTTIEPYSYPNYEPEVLAVGGTSATVSGSFVRTAEVGWGGSGGGWSTKAVAFNTRPTWQAGTGVPTTINYRMGPDLALHASGSSAASGGGAYPFYFGGSLVSNSFGTSFSSPVLCGMLAIAEQKLIALNSLPANTAGKRRLGRLQNVIYAQNGRTDVWYDVVTGSNGTLPAAINGSTSSVCTAKWDTVTGWGAMNVDGFVASQTITPCPADLNGTRTVDGADLGMLLAAWGTATYDLNGDGTVDGADLGIMLAAWGNCP